MNLNLEKNSTHNRIIITGKGGAGKDFLRRKLEAKGWKYGVLYTSRPARTNEKYGTDYFFVTNEQFNDLKETSQLVESSVFAHGWQYGTALHIWETCNLFVMSPNSLRQVKEKFGLDNTFVIYLNTPEDVRRVRLSSRQDADSAERRLLTDKEDFENFKNYDIKITDPDF
jgi:guanylate kinase